MAKPRITDHTIQVEKAVNGNGCLVIMDLDHNETTDSGIACRKPILPGETMQWITTSGDLIITFPGVPDSASNPFKDAITFIQTGRGGETNKVTMGDWPNQRFKYTITWADRTGGFISEDPQHMPDQGESLIAKTLIAYLSKKTQAKTKTLFREDWEAAKPVLSLLENVPNLPAWIKSAISILVAAGDDAYKDVSK